MTFKNNRAPLLSNIKLYASFHHHTCIQTGVTVQKRLRWVVTSVTLTFDLWPRPFAWTLPWSLGIASENFMMIQWWEHSQKGGTDGGADGQTDGRTDGQTDRNIIHRAAWSQLKITKTTRMPAFCDTPATPWLPTLGIHIRSQVKTRESQSYKLKKNAKNSNFEILQETLHGMWLYPTFTNSKSWMLNIWPHEGLISIYKPCKAFLGKGIPIINLKHK